MPNFDILALMETIKPIFETNKLILRQRIIQLLFLVVPFLANFCGMIYLSIFRQSHMAPEIIIVLVFIFTSLLFIGMFVSIDAERKIRRIIHEKMIGPLAKEIIPDSQFKKDASVADPNLMLKSKLTPTYTKYDNYFETEEISWHPQNPSIKNARLFHCYAYVTQNGKSVLAFKHSVLHLEHNSPLRGQYVVGAQYKRTNTKILFFLFGLILTSAITAMSYTFFQGINTFTFSLLLGITLTLFIFCTSVMIYFSNRKKYIKNVVRDMSHDIIPQKANLFTFKSKDYNEPIFSEEKIQGLVSWFVEVKKIKDPMISFFDKHIIVAFPHSSSLFKAPLAGGIKDKTTDTWKESVQSIKDMAEYIPNHFNL